MSEIILDKQTVSEVVDATTTFYGEAKPGVAETEPGWKITKVTTAVVGPKTTVTKTYPLGSKHGPSVGEEFRWSERSLLTFSQIPVAPTQGIAQTLLSVSIASSNTNPALAMIGDTVTLTIVAKELIENMVVSIAGHIVNETIGIDRKHFTATHIMSSDDVTGAVPFSIDWTDLGGNIAVQEVATTDASSVTFDKTAVTASILYSKDGGATYTSSISVKDADTLRIKATFSEPLLDSPVVKLSIDNSILSATAMTKTSTTVYYYDLNVPTGNIAVATCSLSVGKDLAGNVITATPTAGATFKVDNTVVVFTGVSTTPSTAASGTTVTSIFTTSEPLVANPTVTIGVQAMTFVSLVGSTYTYSRVLNGTETEGSCQVLVTGTDTAGNTTTNTLVGFTTADFTGPFIFGLTVNSPTEILVQMDEVLNTASITKANNGGFVVKDTTNGLTSYTVSAIAPSGAPSLDEIKLTVADFTAQIGSGGVTVTYVAGGNGTVADVLGNLSLTDATGVSTE